MKRHSGYTLIEAVVVLAILGISLSLVTPMIFKGISGTRLKATAREITSALRFARNVAITKRALVFFGVDLDTNQYTMQLITRDRPKFSQPTTPGSEVMDSDDDMPGQAVSGGDNFMAEMKMYDVQPPLELIRCSDLEGNHIEEGRFGIIFFPKGNCTGGSIEIGKPEGQHLIIAIEPVTANVDVVEAQRW